MSEAGRAAEPGIDGLPGFRRRIRVEAAERAVVAMVEDDMHCMAVTLRHDGKAVLKVEPEMERAPWTTCPGAPVRLIDTFEGVLLSDVTSRRDKRLNCTHLHDLAVLAAAHAGGRGGLAYEILASDPVDGRRILEIRRNGEAIHRWIEDDGKLTEPAELAGQTLFTLRDWINAQPEPAQEAARLLQWGGIMAHGRTLPYEQQSIATSIPPNCFTFQPERAVHAVRVGKSFDFSDGSRVPLGEFGDRVASGFGEG